MQPPQCDCSCCHPILENTQIVENSPASSPWSYQTAGTVWTIAHGRFLEMKGTSSIPVPVHTRKLAQLVHGGWFSLRPLDSQLRVHEGSPLTVLSWSYPSQDHVPKNLISDRPPMRTLHMPKDLQSCFPFQKNTGISGRKIWTTMGVL